MTAIALEVFRAQLIQVQIGVTQFLLRKVEEIRDVERLLCIIPCKQLTRTVKRERTEFRIFQEHRRKLATKDRQNALSRFATAIFGQGQFCKMLCFRKI